MYNFYKVTYQTDDKKIIVKVWGQNKDNAKYNARSIRCSNPDDKAIINSSHFVDIEKLEDADKGEKIKCEKCNGYGYIGKFAQYRDGVCYDCKGTGYHYEYKDSYEIINL